MSKVASSALLLYCRAGFEDPCAAEIQAKAAAWGVYGHCRARPGRGYVIFEAYAPGDAEDLHRRLRFSELVFARQWFVIVASLQDLPEDDRVTPMVAAAKQLPGPVDAVFVETPDTESGKALSRLARALSGPLNGQLKGSGLTADRPSGLRFHVCLVEGTAAYVGYSRVANASPWLSGIPRLRRLRAAPSRSALKLEEAFLCFFSDSERAKRLRAGMQAVDLGAAPGGWSWYLAQRGLHVRAVDNGPLDRGVLETGLVEHVRDDGFRYRPPEPVDWLICDMIEQPVRIAELVGQWCARGWSRQAIVNLKLPMKKRYQEVQRCLERVHQLLDGAGLTYELICKHLYHDRDEVTVYIGLD